MLWSSNVEHGMEVTVSEGQISAHMHSLTLKMEAVKVSHLFFLLCIEINSHLQTVFSTKLCSRKQKVFIVFAVRVFPLL
jgi:hypothetical protein